MAAQQPDSTSEMKQTFNLGSHLVYALAFPVVIWTTRFGTWGKRYLTTSAVMGIVWPLGLGVLYGPHPRLMDLFRFWLACIVLLLVHRVAGIVRRWRGYRCHSRSWGRSWLDRGNDESSERRARISESVLAAALGFLLYHAGSGPLGVLLMIGGVTKLLTDAIVYLATEARLREMEDAKMETEYFADRFRQRVG